MATYYCTKCSAKTEASIVNLHGTLHDGCVLAGTWFTEPPLTAEMEQVQVTIEQLRGILQEAEDAAFALSEHGGTFEERSEVIDNAVAKVFILLGVERICYGCGMYLDECVCLQKP